ncbi:HlyD family secretion protein [Phenylobacterium sp. SCN 70-31]|uniref:HlyD family secretion protein n=1 Tax=Phenylobacterium sp. SCN 70-31 TaxID=1660129 RepID=UPI00086C69B8|nr:HlyD family secretion protein [Phenylobacterium sp. SCN 70-31]ODT85780.1 MAG: multidrug ABC transporter permease [Phenylobacterium sp. SCN 70-31]
MTTTDGSNPAEDNPARPRGLADPRVRRGLLLAALVLAVLGAFWFVRHQQFGRFQQSTDNSYIAADSVVVASKIAGYVDAVLVTDNQLVRRGEALAKIDSRDYGAQASQASAQIAVALAGADTLRAQRREQDAAIQQARAQLGAIAAQARLASQQVARYRPLAATGAEAREKLDQFEMQSEQAASQVAAARATLAAAERRRDTLGAQLRQAGAQAEAAQAQLEAAQLNVASATLRASISGRVGDLTLRPGQFVQPGQRLMSIVPRDRVYVTANFKETQLGLIRPGQEVRIEVDALPGVDLRGRVESIAPGTGAEFSILPPQNATGNFTKIVQRVPVRIALLSTPEVRRLLVPGMSVVVTIDTRNARGQLDRLRRANP